jgi:hypothetical protein
MIGNIVTRTAETLREWQKLGGSSERSAEALQKEKEEAERKDFEAMPWTDKAVVLEEATTEQSKRFNVLSTVIDEACADLLEELKANETESIALPEATSEEAPEEAQITPLDQLSVAELLDYDFSMRLLSTENFMAQMGIVSNEVSVEPN